MLGGFGWSVQQSQRAVSQAREINKLNSLIDVAAAAI